AAAVIGLLALTIFLWNPPVLRHLDTSVLDWYFQLRGPVQPRESAVAVVTIDDRSIQELGPWPWPRARIASLINTLSRDFGARTIATDLVFSEPERNIIEEARQWMARRGHGDARLLQQFEQKADGDEKLAHVLHDAGNVVEGFYYFSHPDSPQEPRKIGSDF
ncbi:MAG: CHASE2 domain-containing protein, partial [Deltaproteobacteria bacterium]